MLLKLKCKECSAEFDQKTIWQKYCREDCRVAANKKIYYVDSRFKEGLPPSTVGAALEMLVCADLLQRGLYVFRSVSPNSPGDLVVMTEREMWLVEVTVGYRNIEGELLWGPHKKYEGVFDLIAVVEKNGQITYVPDLNEILDEKAVDILTAQELWGISAV